MTIFLRNLSKPSNLSVAKSMFLYKSPLQATRKVYMDAASTLPRTSNEKAVGYWLLGTAAAISGAMAVGGVGRLKESRFSGVSGFKFKKTRPPKSEEEWQSWFRQFTNHPEYKAHLKEGKAAMTLKDFKRIWRLDYWHDQLTMGVPVIFLGPLMYIGYSGRLAAVFHRLPRMKTYIYAGAGLMATQGALAVAQMRAGIDPMGRTDKDIYENRQYRLASHLFLAYAQYMTFLWAGLTAILKHQDYSSVPKIGTMRTLAYTTKGFVFVTVLFGAFMAGTDAGLIFNNWPFYDNTLFVPPKKGFFELQPWWRNFFESKGTIQWTHRHLAYGAAGMAAFTWMFAKKIKLGGRAGKAVNLLLMVAMLQGILGVTTLWKKCDTKVASLHQLGSVSLVSAALWLVHELRRVPK